MTVVVWQFFSSILGYVQYVSHILAENVGSQSIFYLSR